MGEIAMPSDLKLISERMRRLFKPRSQTRYWLQVVNDRYDQCFNFFFNSQRQGERLKSVPLHTLYHYDLNALEELLRSLRQQTNLTIQLLGFVGLKWPSTQKVIQRRRQPFE